VLGGAGVVRKVPQVSSANGGQWDLEGRGYVISDQGHFGARVGGMQVGQEQLNLTSCW
jgi:hypothetical protein